MRYLFLAAVLVVGLATTASAREAIGVTGFTVGRDGQLSGTGTVGGVDGTITSTVSSGDCASSCEGTWTMMVANANFVAGTFTCVDSACVYIGDVAVRDSTGFTISTGAPNPGMKMAGAIYQHALWANDVSAWANLHPDVMASLNLSVSDFISRATQDSGTQISQ